MSLTGALLAAVSGLQAQSNAVGIISDNIANLNTIGFKKSDATFSTLVVNSAATTTFSPGGVQSGRFARIATQGTLQASSNPLDVAITGNGFFPVNDQGNNLGNNLFTRAGSFHQDVQGRLVNTAGFFLQGFVLTQTGAIANPNQLSIVSVGTTNGVAVDTQHVTVGANLDSTQTQFQSNSDSSTQATITNQTSDLGVGLALTSAGSSVQIAVLGNVYTLAYSAAGFAAFTGPATSQTGTFKSLADLASLVDSIPGVQGSIVAGANPEVKISSSYAANVTELTNGTALGFTVGTTAAPSIAANYAFGNMQSGAVTPQFSDPLQVFDALGTAHTLNLSVIRTDSNQWAYELYSAPVPTPTQAQSDADIGGSVAVGRGLISSGLINFNGDGSLNGVTNFPAVLPSGINNQPLYGGVPLAPIPVQASAGPPVTPGIVWANGAKTSTITFNLGTAGALGTGKTDGLTQFASQGAAGGGFTKNFVNQDGAAVGLQTGVTIDKSGFVIVSFSNGATQKLFQVPVTTFADPSALQAQVGNTFSQTVSSGSSNNRIAGTAGAGTIAPSSLEESNADLGDEFAHLITTQTAYSANSKTITTSNTLLQELLQIIQ